MITIKSDLMNKEKESCCGIKIAFLSNVVFEPYFQHALNQHFNKQGFFVEVKSFDLNNVESLQNAGEIEECDIVVISLNFDESYPNFSIQDCKKEIRVNELVEFEVGNAKHILSLVKSKTSIPVFWFGYEDYFINTNNVVNNLIFCNGIIDRINQAIIETLNEEIVYFDTKRLIANIGIRRAYNNKNKYRWSSPYSKEMIEQFASTIYKQYLVNKGLTPKCIVIDCDNVLWGGVVSEVGIEGIKIGGIGSGRAYQEFQRFLLYLYYHGVILAICSKNDEADVLKVFNEHSGMILESKHIACFCVNWNNKVDNIIEISKQLNIGLDSIVFIDDSDFEIQSVVSFLPEVLPLKYRDNTSIFNELSCFCLPKIVDIDKVIQRNLTYKTNMQREKIKANTNDFDKYINLLEMNIDIHEAKGTEYVRISELTQRTNKCTNGTRYTLEEIKKEAMDKNFHLYSVSVSDKFSDLGIVGAVAIKNETLMLFSLSCRALGRKIEEHMIEYINKIHRINKITFKSTSKNLDIEKYLKEYILNLD